MAELWAYTPEQGTHRVEAPSTAPTATEPTPPAVPEVPAEVPSGETLPESAPAPGDQLEPQGESEGEEPQQEPSGQGGFQRRIRNLTREKYDLRNEIVSLRAQIAYMAQQQATGQQASSPASQQSPQTPQSPASSPTGRPRFEDFNGNNEAYWDALTEWKAGQLIEARFQAMQQSQADQARQVIYRQWNDRILEGQTLHEDFDDALHVVARGARQDLFSVIERVAAAQDNGAALLYALGKRPALLRQVNDLVPEAAQRWLQDQARRLSQGAQIASPPQSLSALATNLHPPTQAPPVRPLAGSSVQGALPSAHTADIAERGGPLIDYIRGMLQEQQRRPG